MMNGWSLPSALTGSAVVIAALSLVGMVIRMIGPWNKQITDMGEKLRAELYAERERCEADLGLARHRERNSRQMIYAMLHLFEMSEDDRKAPLNRIHQRLAAIEAAEAAEVGAMRGERISEAEEVV